MWWSLGFRRQGEKRGRGKEDRVLVGWWRDHGHPGIFTSSHEGTVVRAAVDINFIRDLVESQRPDRDESLALADDQLIDRLDLVRTPTLDLEIDAMSGQLRTKCAARSLDFSAVSPERGLVEPLFMELLTIAQSRNIEFAAEPQSQKDLHYVAEAITAGLDAVITRDARLAEVMGDAATARGVRILRPSEAIVRIDELVRAHAYQPGAIRSTQFTSRTIPSGLEDRFNGFSSRATGERQPAFRQLLRSLTNRGLERIGWSNPDGTLVGIYARELVGSILDVQLLRVLEGSAAPTLVRQILFVLREEAVAQNASVIRLSDPHLARGTLIAAAEDGFVTNGANQLALVIDVIGSANEVARAAVEASRAAGLEEPPTPRSQTPAVIAAEIERLWWPVKLIDSRLPSFLIPIQQRWSRELLGAPLGLFARSATLGLSREHVYYRSPHGPKLRPPTRLLWYMSGSAQGTVEPAGVVAASLLEEVVEGTPEDLDERFRHLGVWSVAEIVGAAKQGTAQALRFTYTEAFEHTVGRALVEQLVGTVPFGPRGISSDVFETLYRAGHKSG
jgi:hypothetical protein